MFPAIPWEVVVLSLSLGGTVIKNSFYSTLFGEYRNIQVYLPPGSESYVESSLPLALFLPGTELNETDYPELFSTVDELIQLGTINPIVVVKIDGNWYPPPTVSWDCTAMPTWYNNNSAIGDFHGLIVNELLPYLFSNYPAIDSSRIAITGHSAGGWGALSLGVRFPEVFKAIVAMSPVWSLAKIAYDLVDNPAASWLRVVDYSALPPSTTQSPENGYFSDVQFKLCYAASPASSFHRIGGDWSGSFSLSDVDNFVVGHPVASSIENVTLDEQVVERIALLDVVKWINKEQLAQWNSLFYFDVGMYDPLLLTSANEEAHDFLSQQGIEHHFEVFSSGIGCLNCSGNVNPATGNCTEPNVYMCGQHFADWDNMKHGACISKAYNGLPYVGAIKSRLQVALPLLNEALKDSVSTSAAPPTNCPTFLLVLMIV